MHLVSVRCAAVLGVLLWASLAYAVPIGLGSFGTGAVVESFEGLAPGPNSPKITDLGFLKPGVVAPFTFASGVTLTGPIPNVGVGADGRDARGVLVGDRSIGPVTFALGDNGVIDPDNLAPPDGRPHGGIPDGNAFLALNANPGPIEFTFASDVFRVGALVAGSPGFVTLSAFDASGTLLEAHTLTVGSVTTWATTFVGLENAAGIRRIVLADSNALTGFNALALDRLTFEPAATLPVPEPASWLLVVSGLAIARRRVKIDGGDRHRAHHRSSSRRVDPRRPGARRAEL